MHSSRWYGIAWIVWSRYVVCCALSFCTLLLYAQQDMAQRLDEVLRFQDFDACKDLLQELTEEDLLQMADSTLFDYYYMAAWCKSEEGDFEKAINHLACAKVICETRLGIHNRVFAYFEIVNAMGKLYEALCKDDEALPLYEDGIVKGLTYLHTTDQTLRSYLDEMRNSAASIYERMGQSSMSHFLRGIKGPSDADRIREQ